MNDLLLNRSRRALPVDSSPNHDATNTQVKKLINADNCSLSALEEDILTVLLGQRLYGLQISQAIELASEGKQILQIGSLYPTLSRLEKKGYIQGKTEAQRHPGRGGARKRYYQITSLGANVLTERQKLRAKLAQIRFEE